LAGETVGTLNDSMSGFTEGLSNILGTVFDVQRWIMGGISAFTDGLGEIGSLFGF